VYYSCTVRRSSAHPFERLLQHWHEVILLQAGLPCDAWVGERLAAGERPALQRPPPVRQASVDVHARRTGGLACHPVSVVLIGGLVGGVPRGEICPRAAVADAGAVYKCSTLLRVRGEIMGPARWNT
jgi:hypothetical protein